LKGQVAGAATWADTWVCPYQKLQCTAISNGKCRIILLLFKTIEFKSWRLQLIIYKYSENKRSFNIKKGGI